MPKQNYLCIQRSQPGEKREKPSPAQMEECTSSDQSGPMSLFCKRDFLPVDRSMRRV